MNNQDWYDYFNAFKNPLDKKVRWEVNDAYKKQNITDEQRVKLLKVTDKDLSPLVKLIANKVPIKKEQVGNYYYKRALYIYKRQLKHAQKPLNFSK